MTLASEWEYKILIPGHKDNSSIYTNTSQMVCHYIILRLTEPETDWRLYRRGMMVCVVCNDRYVVPSIYSDMPLKSATLEEVHDGGQLIESSDYMYLVSGWEDHNGMEFEEIATMKNNHSLLYSKMKDIYSQILLYLPYISQRQTPIPRYSVRWRCDVQIITRR